MRKTKIICTLGPACDTDDLLKKMIENGLDCARLNFSHGTHEEQKVRMDRVKRIRQEMNIPLPILLDTKGPEIRVRLFKDKKVMLKKGQEFTFCSDYDMIGDETKVGLTYPDLAKYVYEPGIKILADDGKVSFEVLRTEGKNVVCKVLNDATLSDRKSINIPNVIVDMPYISDADRSDLIFGIQECVDYIAASFVRRKEDVLELRKLLDEYDTSGKIRIISKIENTEGIEKMDEIIEVSDGIMVARGDMGVEVPFTRLPAIQKNLISKCYRAGKIVVTATQMLDSMQQNPRPTRAEVSDCHNAVLDGTSATMLSGESAQGDYPFEAVTYMSKIDEKAEDDIDHQLMIENVVYGKEEKNEDDAIGLACATLAAYFEIPAIVAEGTVDLALALSQYRPATDIYFAVASCDEARTLSVVWGVQAVVGTYQDALAKAQKELNIASGDKIIKVSDCKLELVEAE